MLATFVLTKCHDYMFNQASHSQISRVHKKFSTVGVILVNCGQESAPDMEQVVQY